MTLPVSSILSPTSPSLLLAYKTLGRELVIKTIVCAVSYSLFYSIIPIPSTPIIDDYLTACMKSNVSPPTQGYTTRLITQVFQSHERFKEL